jgi:hypothetical protein
MAYCVRKDVERCFGRRNVKAWADIDNEGVAPDDPERAEIEADIEDRINYFIDIGCELINTRLTTRSYHNFLREYTENPTIGIPKIITYLNALLAGTELFDARAVNYSAEAERYELRVNRQRAESIIENLNNGSMKLEHSGWSSKHTTAPEVVPRT